MATPFILTARIQTALDNASLAQATKILRKTLSAKPVSLKVIVDDARLKKRAETLGTVDASARRAQAGMTGFAHSVKLAATRFMAFTLAASVMIKLTMALREGFKQAAEFDREIVRLTQVTGKSAQGLKPLVREITQLSESLGVSSLKMVEMSRILAQTGMSAKDTAIALKAIAKTELAPTFTDIKKPAEGAIAAMRQFNIEARDLEATLGAINAVSKRFAVESDDIITAIRRTGGVFQAAGGQINELIAIFTSVRATTRETAETIATGLRTIFTRIQRPKTIKFLRQFGIELTDLQGQFVGPMEAIRRLSVALRGMETTDLQFGRIIEQLGGFRQVGKVIPMITQHETAVKALGVAQAGSNSLALDAAKAQKALLVQVSKVKEEFMDMMRKMMASEGFKSMISMTLKLASSMIKLVEALEPVLPMLMALSAIKLGGMAMGGMRGMRAGGMARGGVVPGSGNRDTVPAMLTPGEFVIKKSSAEKLGYGNLKGMNKYATGGQVKLGGSFGGAFLQPRGVKDVPQLRKWNGPIGSGAALANRINLAMVGGVGKKGGKGALADPYKGRLKEQLDFKASGADKKAFANQLIKTNPAVAAKWLGGKDKLAAFQTTGTFPSGMGTKSMKWFQGKVSPNNMRGALGKAGMFMAMTGMRKDQQVLPTDIGKGVKLSGMSNEFGVGSDAKDTFKTVMNRHMEAMIGEFIGPGVKDPRWKNIQSRAGGDAVEGHMFEAFMLANSEAKEISTDSSENFDLYSTTHNPKISRLFGAAAGNIKNLDAKRTFDAGSQASIIKKAANEFAQRGSGSGITAQYQPITGKDKRTRTLMAAGGSVGTDTVPALLTPGEFVINKKSASRIGMGALKSMNKYADGGIVQRFAGGGGVSPGTLSFKGLDSGNAKMKVFSQQLTKMGVSAEKNARASLLFENSLLSGTTDIKAVKAALKDLGMTVTTTTEKKKKEAAESARAAEADRKEAEESRKAAAADALEAKATKHAAASKALGMGGGGGGMGGGGMMMMMALPMIMPAIESMMDMGGATEEAKEEMHHYTGILMGVGMALMMFGSKLGYAGQAMAVITAAAYAYATAQVKAAEKQKEAAIKAGQTMLAAAKAEEEARWAATASTLAIGGAIAVAILAIIAHTTALLVAAGTITVAFAIATGGISLLATAALVAAAAWYTFVYGAEEAAQAARREAIARSGAVIATGKFDLAMKGVERDLKKGRLGMASPALIKAATDMAAAMATARGQGIDVSGEEYGGMSQRMTDVGGKAATMLSKLAVEGGKQGKSGQQVIAANQDLIKAHAAGAVAALRLAAAEAKQLAIKENDVAAQQRARQMELDANAMYRAAMKDMEDQINADVAAQDRLTQATQASSRLFRLHTALMIDLGSVTKELTAATIEAADSMRGIDAAASLGMGKVGTTKIKGTRGAMLSGGIGRVLERAWLANVVRTVSPRQVQGVETHGQIRS